MRSLLQFLLIWRILRTRAKNLTDAELINKVLKGITERTCLWCTASRAGNCVPVVGDCLVGGCGSRVAEENGSARESREVDGVAGCGGERDGGNGQAGQVIACSVVFWLGNVGWERRVWFGG